MVRVKRCLGLTLKLFIAICARRLRIRMVRSGPCDVTAAEQVAPEQFVALARQLGQLGVGEGEA